MASQTVYTNWRNSCGSVHHHFFLFFLQLNWVETLGDSMWCSPPNRTARLTCDTPVSNWVHILVMWGVCAWVCVRACARMRTQGITRPHFRDYLCHLVALFLKIVWSRRGTITQGEGGSGERGGGGSQRVIKSRFQGGDGGNKGAMWRRSMRQNDQIQKDRETTRGEQEEEEEESAFRRDSTEAFSFHQLTPTYLLFSTFYFKHCL